MSNYIYSKTTDKGLQSFYLVANGKEHFLFIQKFRRGVKNFFSKKVILKDALDFSKANNDTALIKTIAKLPSYIKYIEKEYGIFVFNKTIKKNQENYKRNKNKLKEDFYYAA